MADQQAAASLRNHGVGDSLMADRIFTADEKLAAVRRELNMRRRVYPRWVSNGKMSQAKADEETAVMEAIVADYERQVAGERLL